MPVLTIISQWWDMTPAYLVALFHVGPAAWSVYHALLYKRDTRSATGWIMTCLFVPFAGPVAYFLFGINRIQNRATGLRNSFYNVSYEGQRPASVAAAGRVRGLKGTGGEATGRPITSHNAIAALHNGDAAYPEMLNAINGARHYVVLASYIIQRDKSGILFAEALGRAVERGVIVKVLVDGVGEWYSIPRITSLLRRLGVTTGRFLPPTFWPPSVYINLRNHRKLLVVDGQVAFAGGMNIADGNVTRASKAGSNSLLDIRDLHFRLEGAVVQELASLFMHDWQFSTGDTGGLPSVAESVEAGECECRVIPDGPDSSLDALSLTIRAAVSCAKNTIDIMTPYFLPNRELTSALISAMLRGVRVRIVLPKVNNLPIVHWANRNTLFDLLQWGAQVYYQPAPFCHTKLFCVDSDYSLIGSANIDERSLRLNFELGVEVFSADFNASLSKHVDAVAACSEPLLINALRDRSILARLRDSLAALLSPYL